ncbi:SHOCT domain-containing protein [Acidiferrimicrobium sp. IK]|uniref:SHOCT domain-containing protein n=1 Tax=Acidiferrimicrobium sp. IK TaxID=2871700 RepID=UPI0021CB5486|nr:SHOCT domain-containing protein [Acidiferrimicrobium sp. IK]
MMYGGWHSGGWDAGAWIGMVAVMVVFWAAVVAVVVMAFRHRGGGYLSAPPPPPAGPPASEGPERDGPDAALRLLEQRFARGEIDAEEFGQRRDLLRSR